MQVIGGVYQESCQFPQDEKIRGSGGRAAIFLAQATSVTFTTCANSETLDAFALSAKKKSVNFQVASVFDAELSSFIYLHQAGKALLKTPYIPNRPKNWMRLISEPIRDDVILKYGMLEGDVPTEGRYVIYDPQSSRPLHYHANGSTAEKLAIVANEYEVRALMDDAKSDVFAVAKKLKKASSAEVVVVKDGPKGAFLVYGKDNAKTWVPAYCSRRVRKIGSGDIFAAAFAYFWGEKKLAPRDAANLASMTTSKYAESGDEVFYQEDVLRKGVFHAVEKKRQRVYIAGPFFDPAQKWLIDEIRQCLIDLGCDFFSPFHEAGLAGADFDSQHQIARMDLDELDGCDIVLAVLDGIDLGTVFEVGYACAKRKPVVALNHRLPDYQLTMLKSTYRCLVVNDLASALYHAAWGLQRKGWQYFHDSQKAVKG